MMLIRASTLLTDFVSCLLLLLLCLPLNSNSLVLPFGTTALPPKCAIPEVALPKYTQECAEYLPESEYSVQQVGINDIQVTDIQQDTNKGTLRASLLLAYNLKPIDTLLILLNSRDESRSRGRISCRRLAICNRQLDVSRQLLRFSVILAEKTSYTVQIFKLADRYLCEAPQVRFFHTEVGRAFPVQMTVKSCDECTGDSRKVICQMDMYLKGNGTHTVKVLTATNKWHRDIDFAENSQNSGSAWRKKSFEISFEAGDASLTVYYGKTPNSNNPFNFQRLTNLGSESLRTQLCQRPLPNPHAVCAPRLTPTPRNPPIDRIQLLPGFFLALLLSAAALTLAVAARYYHRGRAMAERLLLVLPETTNRCRFARFRQELRAADAVKQGRICIRELTGLRALTPELAKNSCFVVFLSDDEAFSCFPMEELKEELRTLVLTEKNRRRAFYSSKGESPAEGTVWKQLNAEHLEENSISKIVNGLMAQCDTMVVMTTHKYAQLG